MNKEKDGLNITTFNDINYLEFYLSSSKNIIFKLELYDYLGPKKLIFDKLNFKDNFIDSLKKEAREYKNKSKNTNPPPRFLIAHNLLKINHFFVFFTFDSPF